MCPIDIQTGGSLAPWTTRLRVPRSQRTFMREGLHSARVNIPRWRGPRVQGLVPKAVAGLLTMDGAHQVLVHLVRGRAASEVGGRRHVARREQAARGQKRARSATDTRTRGSWRDPNHPSVKGAAAQTPRLTSDPIRTTLARAAGSRFWPGPGRGRSRCGCCYCGRRWEPWLPLCSGQQRDPPWAVPAKYAAASGRSWMQSLPCPRDYMPGIAWASWTSISQPPGMFRWGWPWASSRAAAMSSASMML
jgi:hypothetical protein